MRKKEKQKETDRKGKGYLLNYCEPNTLTCPILSKS